MKTTPELKNFVLAASEGRIQELKLFLRQQPSLINDPRPLVAAALHGRAAAVRLLLEAGADPNAVAPSHERYRPLHRAIEHRAVPKNPGHVEVITQLIAAGADIELRSTWMGLTALAVAAMVGDEEILALVLRHKPAIDIFAAAVLADAKKLEQLLAKSPGLAKAKDTNSMTVLHYAALCGRKGAKIESELCKMAELLLANGANPDACEDIGPYKQIPVLHFAAWGNIVLARVLLERGANPNLGFGNCLWREPKEMAKLFLGHGADVNGRESSGQPLLNSRIHWNLPSVVLWLLKNGANPNATDAQGNTALHEAADRGINDVVVQALLAKGAQTGTRNKAGKTALDIAQEKKRTKIVKILAAL